LALCLILRLALFTPKWLWGSEIKDSKPSSTLTYRIYAMEYHVIKKVIEELNHLCNNETTRHVFDSEDDQKAVTKMKNEHVC
jgi:hypothetical protein